MTVGALLDEVSSAELTEWQGFGEFEAEQQAATGTAPAPAQGDAAKLIGGL